MVTLDPDLKTSSARPLVMAGLLFVVELTVIGFLFKHFISFTCLDNWPGTACRGASGSMIAVYCALGALTLAMVLRPAPFRAVMRAYQDGRPSWPLGLNLAGVAVTLIPLLFLREGTGATFLWPSLASWTIGLAVMLAGLALYLAPARNWTQFFRESWSMVLPVLAAGLATPYLSTLIRPVWQLETIASTTFGLVAKIIGAMGYEVFADPDTKVIGIEDFYIRIANVCSGVEGMALVTVFVTLYLSLFRSELRFPLAFLLYPIGLLASAAFNVVRITVLLILGIEGNPDLAVGGFHSHAGWLMFTLVALGIIALAQTVPALKRDTGQSNSTAAQEQIPFRHDPMAAKILPFAIFMLSALFVSAFASQPALAYPLRVIAMIAAVGLFWPIMRKIEWRLDPVAIAVGAAIAVMWIAVPVEPGEAPYGELSGALLLGWFLARGIGTILLVPLIEELFFRDYLERKLRLGTGPAWPFIAAIITAALFAALHDRLLEAFLAGLALSYVMNRAGRVGDAILAHAVANGLIFGVAIATGNLAMI